MTQLFRFRAVQNWYTICVQRTRLTTLAGFICGLSFLTPLWFGALAGMSLFFYVLFSGSRNAVIQTTIFAIIVQGFAYAALYFDTIPLPWLTEVPIIWHVAYISIAWVFTVLLATLPFVAWGYAYAHLSPTRFAYKLTIIPWSWMCAEWLSSQTIALGMRDTNYSFPATSSTIGYIGNQLADSPLFLQFASLGSVYILTLLTAAIAVLLSHTYLRHGIRSYKTLLPIVLCVGGIIASSFATFTAPTGTYVPITLITTYTPSVFTITPQERAGADERIMQSIVGHQGSIVILPEATEFLKRNRDTLLKRISPDATADHTVIVDSESVLWGSTRTRRAEYFDVSEKRSVFTSKEFFVPFGEYMPNVIESFASIVAPHFLASVGKDRIYVPGKSNLIETTRGIAASLRMCNEIVSADLYRRDALEGADVLFNVASHSWYHGSEKVERQILRAAKIRAVENHRYLALSNSSAPSFALDWFGQEIIKTPWHSEIPIVANVQTSEYITFYTRYGTFVLILFGILSLFLLLCSSVIFYFCSSLFQIVFDRIFKRRNAL